MDERIAIMASGNFVPGTESLATSVDELAKK